MGKRRDGKEGQGRGRGRGRARGRASVNQRGSRGRGRGGRGRSGEASSRGGRGARHFGRGRATGGYSVAVGKPMYNRIQYDYGSVGDDVSGPRYHPASHVLHGRATATSQRLSQGVELEGEPLDENELEEDEEDEEAAAHDEEHDEAQGPHDGEDDAPAFFVDVQPDDVTQFMQDSDEDSEEEQFCHFGLGFQGSPSPAPPPLPAASAPVDMPLTHIDAESAPLARRQRKRSRSNKARGPAQRESEEVSSGLVNDYLANTGGDDEMLRSVQKLSVDERPPVIESSSDEDQGRRFGLGMTRQERRAALREERAQRGRWNKARRASARGRGRGGRGWFHTPWDPTDRILFVKGEPLFSEPRSVVGTVAVLGEGTCESTPAASSACIDLDTVAERMRAPSVPQESQSAPASMATSAPESAPLPATAAPCQPVTPQEPVRLPASVARPATPSSTRGADDEDRTADMSIPVVHLGSNAPAAAPDEDADPEFALLQSAIRAQAEELNGLLRTIAAPAAPPLVASSHEGSWSDIDEQVYVRAIVADGQDECAHESEGDWSVSEGESEGDVLDVASDDEEGEPSEGSDAPLASIQPGSGESCSCDGAEAEDGAEGSSSSSSSNSVEGEEEDDEDACDDLLVEFLADFDDDGQPVGPGQRGRWSRGPRRRDPGSGPDNASDGDGDVPRRRPERSHDAKEAVRQRREERAIRKATVQARKKTKGVRRKGTRGGDEPQYSPQQMNALLRDFVNCGLASSVLPKMRTQERHALVALARIYNVKCKGGGGGKKKMPFLFRTAYTAIPSKDELAVHMRKATTRGKDGAEEYISIRDAGPRPRRESTPRGTKRNSHARGRGGQRGERGERATPTGGTATVSVSLEAAPIPASNLGHRMLSLMGWSGGGLGANEAGIVEPIDAIIKRNRLGIGHEGGSW